MDRVKLVESLNAEIQKLKDAVALLSEDTPRRTSIAGKSGRPAAFVMNPSARKRISDAQKKRWDKVREAKLQAERAAAAKLKDSSRKTK